MIGLVPFRFLSLAPAAWTAGFEALYLAVVDSQGGSLAWWLIAALAAAVGLLIVAPVRSASGRPLLIAAAVILALSAAAGILSIGILLVPAVVLAAVAAAKVPAQWMKSTYGGVDARRVSCVFFGGIR
jgi:hypothetical protein